MTPPLIDPRLLQPQPAGPASDAQAEADTEGEHQRMLALLIRTTEQGIWFIDNEQRTTDANPAMCRMLGLSLPQVLGRSIFSFVDETNAAVFRERVQRRSQGVADSYQVELRHADGHAVPCWNNATPIFDSQGRKVGAVGMFSDITLLKRAEQQLQGAHELLAQKSRTLEMTLENLRQGVISIGADGRVNAWNQRLLTLLQMPASLLETRPTLRDLARWQVQQGHFSAEQEERLYNQLPEHLPHYRRTRPDGVVLEVETHFGTEGSLVRTFTDVTASVQVEQSLRESESRFRAMADAAPALVWQSDEHGRAVWFNQRWLQYTGHAMEEELALTWEQRMHPDDVERCLARFNSALATRTSYRVEFRLRRPDGSWAQLEDNGIPRVTEDGGFDGFIVYGWDITSRKAAETALIAAKDEAERANRAKSEFLSRMSHELRTPLNAVLGFAQLMQADGADPLSATQQQRLGELQRGARHLLALINDVLDLARIEAGTLPLALGGVDVAAVVGECLPLVQRAAELRPVQLDVRAPPRAARVRADGMRLKQVLLNLLSNAIKYTPPGGQVWLGWAVVPGGVRIEVGDTGPGLAREQQERLFQPFERLDAHLGNVEGAGIGLALSKWLVGLMQGELGVDSTPGAGSLFWVRLQAAGTETPDAVASAPAPLTAAPRPTVPGQVRRVLYIEDNEVNRLLMDGMLAREPSVLLRMAALPEEGLAMAAAEPPDLVLLDIQLPGIDGFEVLRRLRAMPELAAVPVVAVSANAMPSDREKARLAGFADYITKPIDMTLLLATVTRLLAG